MNKIAKRIVAGVSAMALAFSSVAMTASATSGTGKVKGIPVKYSTSITETSSLSTSSFQEDPTKYNFELELRICYQHKDTRTGKATISLVEPIQTSGGGLGHQINAPKYSTMAWAGTNHCFWVNGGAAYEFYSEAGEKVK